MTKKERITVLKDLLIRIHQGENPDNIQEEFNQTFRDISAMEISLMEHQLLEEDNGIGFEDIMKLCDVHANLFRESIDKLTLADIDHPGHPVSLFKQENQAFQAAIIRIRRLINRFEAEPGYLEDPDYMAGFIRQVDLLGQFKGHYKRKEEVFFAHMEHKGHDAPPKVMWGVDDQIRDKFDHFYKEVHRKPKILLANLNESFEDFCQDFQAMIFKEEEILLNILLEILNQEDWYQISQESVRYPYAIIRPQEEWVPQINKAKEGTPGKPIDIKPKENSPKTQTGQDLQEIKLPGGKVRLEWIPDASNQETMKQIAPETSLPLGQGSLTLKEANLILNQIPIELSFVNKDNIFQYFNQKDLEGEMILARVPSQIGRTIEACHPPRIVDMVLELIEDLAQGRRESESLWFKKGSQMILITYQPIQDDQGNFMGVLEMVQDIQPYIDKAGTKKDHIEPL